MENELKCVYVRQLLGHPDANDELIYDEIEGYLAGESIYIFSEQIGKKTFYYKVNASKSTFKKTRKTSLIDYLLKLKLKMAKIVEARYL